LENNSSQRESYSVIWYIFKNGSHLALRKLLLSFLWTISDNERLSTEDVPQSVKTRKGFCKNKSILFSLTTKYKYYVLIFTHYFRSNKLTIYKRKLNQINSEKGFALIMMCLLLPIFLVTCTFIFIGMAQIEIKTTLNHLCRSELLKAQAKSSQIINQLMVNNKYSAKNIKNQRNSYYLIPSTRNNNSNINRDQLIKSLTDNSKQSLINGKEILYNSLLTYKKKLESLVVLSEIATTGISNTTLSLEIESTHLSDTYDPIRLKENFVKLQSLTLHWKYQLKYIPLLETWTNWSQNFEGHCTATLKKEKPWPPILYEDKYYWKQS